jgi:hypothetical protein
VVGRRQPNLLTGEEDDLSMPPRMRMNDKWHGGSDSPEEPFQSSVMIGVVSRETGRDS